MKGDDYQIAKIVLMLFGLVSAYLILLIIILRL